MNRSRKTCAACASAAVLLAAACGGADRPAPEARDAASRAQLSVHEAWARPADSGGMTAGYFTLVNTGAGADTLAGVATDAAEKAELHMSMQQGNTMRMAAMRSLPVPADDSVLFRPLGAHVMLIRTTRSLAAGDTVAFTLTFASGQSLEVRAGVRQP